MNGQTLAQNKDCLSSKSSFSKALHSSVILCPACDLALEASKLAAGEKLLCPRCGETLCSVVTNTLDKTLALSLTGLLLFFPAVCQPLFTFSIMGQEGSGSVLGSAVEMLRNGYLFPGIMVLLTAVIIPFLKFSSLLVLTWQLKRKRGNDLCARLFRFYLRLDEWGMLEVYLIGILVTIIKMMPVVSVQYNFGLFCFVALLALTLSTPFWLDQHTLWQILEEQTPFEPKKERATKAQTS